MSNGKKNRNREGVDPLREQKILMIRNCDWYPRSSNEWWAKGKVYFADQNLWVGNEGQRRGMEKIAKEQRRYIWAKGRLKNTKFGTFFSSTPPPWRMISTTRSANPIFHYAQTSQQNIKRLLSIFSYFSFSLTSSGKTDKKLEAKFDGPNIKIIPKRKRSIHSTNYQLTKS